MRHLAEEASPALVKQGSQNTEGGAGVLVAGVDSLYVSFYGQLPDALYDALDEAKAVAQVAEESVLVPLAFADAPCFLRPSGTRTHAYWLSNEHCQVFLTRRDDVPRVTVHVHSSYLHQVGGAEGAMVEVRRFLGLLGMVVTRDLVSRVDLYADVQGYRFDLEDRENFQARARDSQAYWSGKSLSGLNFGARGGKFYARLYDKALEIRQNSKHTWLYDLWREAGWDGAAPVWRIEFECRRDGLREVQAIDGDTGEVESLDIIQQVMAHLGDLWRYCLGWLSLRDRDPGDVNRSRWPVSPLWQALMALKGFGGVVCKVVRQRIREAALDRLLPGCAGYVTSIGALLKCRDLGKVLHWVRFAIEDRHRERGMSFDERVSWKEMRFGVAA